MKLIDVQQQAWQAVNTGIPFNPDAAFVTIWIERKQGYSGPLGVPVTGELAVDEGGVAQAFSTGLVLHWTGSAVEVL